MPPEVPMEWRDSLNAYIRERLGENRDHLRATDFNHDVLLRFPDGSTLFFKHAFYLISDDWKKIAVFTEHCGYHSFPFQGASVDLLESIWTDVGTH